MQHFQISIYAHHINDFASSSEVSHKYKFQGDEVREIIWDEKTIPEYYTPMNHLQILKSKRMTLIIWYCDEICKEQIVVGQVNIHLNAFTSQHPMVDSSVGSGAQTGVS